MLNTAEASEKGRSDFRQQRGVSQHSQQRSLNSMCQMSRPDTEYGIIFDFSSRFNPIISLIIHEHNLRDVDFDSPYCVTGLIDQIFYRMKFLKTKGFREVQKFSLSDIEINVN